jgi:hypothetical protein
MIYKPIDIYKLAIDTFGEDRVDLDISNWYNENDKGSYNVTIWFPEVKITNSRGNSHLISDLYVRFTVGNIRLDREYKITLNFTGARGNITVKEVSSNYGHSHLSGWWWGIFCTGSSEFKLLMEEVRMNLEEGSWEMLFMSLENYLKWESLEGVPYRYLESIAYSSSSSVDLTPHLRNLAKELPLSAFSFTDGINLVENDELTEYYNEKSPVKSFGNVSHESLRELCDYQNRNYMVNRQFTFLNKVVKQQAVPGETINEQGNYIEKDVVNRYNILLRDKLRTFNENIRYEQLRNLHKENILGKAGIIEQAQSSNIQCA